MFCQKCGKENPDTTQFCGKCGAKLSSEILQTKKVAAYKPHTLTIGMGLFFIVYLYLIPIIPLYPTFTTHVTVVRYRDLCSSALSPCNPWVTWTFYLSWLVALWFISVGIRTKEIESN